MPMLVSETSGRVDQHDRHIQALAETRNWKQVLAQIDKRLKKGKNSRLTLNKALVQIRMPDSETQKAGCELLRTAVDSMAPVLDSDVLEAVEEAANTSHQIKSLRDVASSMWEATLKARPNNEELLLTVVEQKVAAGDWDAARKFCMTKMRSDRDWFLRWLVFVQLIAVSKRSKAQAMVKTMNSGLATKSLAKAVSDAISSTRVGSTPAQLLHSSLMRSFQDIDLLIEIYLKHASYEDLVKLLDSLAESSLSKQHGGRFAYAKERINAMTLSKNWPALLDFSKSLLQEAKSAGPEDGNLLALGDDWAVWNGYLTSLCESAPEDKEALKEAAEMMKLYTHEKKSLNARLAHLTLFLKNTEGTKDLDTNVVDLCDAYISEHGHKLFAFNQLKSCHLLNSQQQKAFLKLYHSHAEDRAKQQIKSQRSARDWLSTEINSLKLEYYHVISAGLTSDRRIALLNAFTANCLRLYKVALKIEAHKEELDKGDNKEVEGPTERFVGDDAAILAAMALIHLWFAADDNALLRCIYVLEMLLLRSKHNYDAILLAIRVHIYAGQFARAAYLYKQLDTKNIQHLSTSWVLVPRISSLHPHPSKLWRDGPEAFLQDGSRWIRSSRGALRRASVEALRHGSYRNFLRSVETFELSFQSISALTYASELDRTSWRYGSTAAKLFSGIELDLVNNDHDSRELTAFPNYEHAGHPNLEVALRPGPLPQLPWLKTQLRSHYLRYVIMGGPLQTEDADALHCLFTEAITANNTESGSPPDLTSHETKESHLVLSLYQTALTLLTVAEKKQSSSSELKEAIQQLVELSNSRASWIASSVKERFNNISLDNPRWHSLFRWDVFHWTHQQLYFNDLLLGVLRFLVLTTRMWKVDAAEAGAELPSAVKTLEKGIEEFRMTSRRWASSIQADLRQPNAIQHLVDMLASGKEEDDVAAELSVGFADMREFAINIVNGWVDSLEAFTTQRKP